MRSLPGVSPSRVLLFAIGIYGALTEEHLQEIHRRYGWPVEFLELKALELGITIEPGQEAA